jgi:hypothetical protein
MHQTLRYLWLSCLSFLAAVVLCVAIQPSDILTHSGFSFYGNFQHTIIPYGIGLSATAYFLLRASLTLKNTQVARSFRVGLKAIALGIFGIVATPTLSSIQLVQDMHVIFGFIIFLAQAALSLHYLIKIRDGVVDWLLLAVQLLAIVAVVLSFHTFSVLPAMLPAQIAAITAFGALLIRGVRRNSGISE